MGDSRWVTAGALLGETPYSPTAPSLALLQQDYLVGEVPRFHPQEGPTESQRSQSAGLLPGQQEGEMTTDGSHSLLLWEAVA